MSSVSLIADFDIVDLATQLAEDYPDRVLIELIAQIDAEVCNTDFSLKLIEALVGAYVGNTVITIGNPEENY
jgi:hypothetical protein